MAEEAQNSTAPVEMPASFSSLESAMTHIQAAQTQETEQTAPVEEQDEPDQAPERSQSDDPPIDEQPEDSEDMEATDSVEDEDGEPDSEHEDPDEEDEELFAVTVNGEQVEVTLEDLQKGYMREADYTRSKQALADNRREVEAQAGQINQTMQQLAAELAQVEAMFVGEPVPAPDINLLQADPTTYEYQKRAHEEYIAGYHNVQAFRADVQQRLEAEAHQKLQESAVAELPKLQAAFPEITDDATLNNVVGRVTGYLMKAYNYTPDDLKGVTDHRLYVMADKARKYDEGRAGKGKKTVRRGTKKFRAGNGRKVPAKKSESDEARERFNQTVSQPTSMNDQVEAAAAALARGGR